MRSQVSSFHSRVKMSVMLLSENPATLSGATGEVAARLAGAAAAVPTLGRGAGGTKASVIEIEIDATRARTATLMVREFVMSAERPFVVVFHQRDKRNENGIPAIDRVIHEGEDRKGQDEGDRVKRLAEGGGRRIEVTMALWA